MIRYDGKWHEIDDSTHAMMVPGGLLMRVEVYAYGTSHLSVSTTFIPMIPGIASNFLRDVVKPLDHEKVEDDERPA